MFAGYDIMQMCIALPHLDLYYDISACIEFLDTQEVLFHATARQQFTSSLWFWIYRAFSLKGLRQKVSLTHCPIFLLTCTECLLLLGGKFECDCVILWKIHQFIPVPSKSVNRRIVGVCMGYLTGYLWSQKVLKLGVSNQNANKSLSLD